MSDESARIIWHRKRTMTGAAGKLHLRVDDITKAKAWVGATISVNVNPGQHTIQTGLPGRGGGKSNKLELRIEAGQDIYLLSRAFDMPGMSLHLSLERTISRRVTETDRYESPTGHEEVRTLDNLQSLSPAVRTFRLTREWMRSYSVGATESVAVTQTAQFNSRLTSIGIQAEQRIEHTYNASFQRRETFEDETVITAAPGTYTQVKFTWKEIHQRGYVDVLDGEALISRTPFDMTVGLTYDQRQTDRQSSLEA